MTGWMVGFPAKPKHQKNETFPARCRLPCFDLPKWTLVFAPGVVVKYNVFLLDSCPQQSNYCKKENFSFYTTVAFRSEVCLVCWSRTDPLPRTEATRGSRHRHLPNSLPSPDYTHAAAPPALLSPRYQCRKRQGCVFWCACTHWMIRGLCIAGLHWFRISLHGSGCAMRWFQLISTLIWKPSAGGRGWGDAALKCYAM